MGHSGKSWHWWYLECNWTYSNLLSTMQDGVISSYSNLVKYTALLLCVTGSCETAFRFVICLHSLCLGKGTTEGLKARVYSLSAAGVSSLTQDSKIYFCAYLAFSDSYFPLLCTLCFHVSCFQLCMITNPIDRVMCQICFFIGDQRFAVILHGGVHEI